MTPETTLNALLNVYRMANSGTPCVANQGQAMDGYSELCNYREILRNHLEKTGASE